MRETQNKTQNISNPLKVLVADDDIPTRMLLRAAISQWGYVITEASDGEEAWNILTSEDAPRLLIIDWLMPKLDGVSLCRRSREQLPFHPYIILLTQVTGITNLITGLEAGADEFLSKPFNMAELKSRLSIGARIISNESKLASSHQKLQMDIANLRSVILPAISMTHDVVNLCSNKADEKDTPQICLNKMNALQLKLEEIKKIIEELQVEANKETCT